MRQVFSKTTPGYREANDMARRMWDAAGDPQAPISVQTFSNALVLLILNHLKNHYDTQHERGLAIMLLAQNLIENLRMSKDHVQMPETRQ